MEAAFDQDHPVGGGRVAVAHGADRVAEAEVVHHGQGVGPLGSCGPHCPGSLLHQHARVGAPGPRPGQVSSPPSASAHLTVLTQPPSLSAASTRMIRL